MNGPVPTLLFLSVFHLIGGIAVGAGLRQLLARQFNCRAIFFIIWGLGFGLGPLLGGIATLTSSHTPYLIVVEIAAFVVPLLITAFIPQDYLSNFTTPPVTGTVFGLIFFLVGAGLLVMLWQTEIWLALLFGICFMLGGAAATISSVRSALKDQ